MPEIKVSIIVFISSFDIKPATIADMIMESNTFTFFKHKMHNKNTDIKAALVTKEKIISIAIYELLLPEAN